MDLRRMGGTNIAQNNKVAAPTCTAPILELGLA